MSRYNKYDPNGILKEKKWRLGWNIAKIIRFEASPRDNHTVYRVTMRNIHDLVMEIAYLVPHEASPHSLLKDLKLFSSGPNKPWVNIKLDLVNNMAAITSMSEVKEPQEEIEAIHQEEKRIII